MTIHTCAMGSTSGDVAHIEWSSIRSGRDKGYRFLGGSQGNERCMSRPPWHISCFHHETYVYIYIYIHFLLLLLSLLFLLLFLLFLLFLLLLLLLYVYIYRGSSEHVAYPQVDHFQILKHDDKVMDFRETLFQTNLVKPPTAICLFYIPYHKP